MSAGEMDRCECQEGHSGPLMVLVAARCSGECGEDLIATFCDCCGGIHRLPFAAPAGCFRDWGAHGTCGAQALLALEPLASFAGVES